MSKSVITLMAAVLLSATALSAQEPKVEEKAAATAAKVEQPRPPEPPAQPVNIRIEVVITDQAGPGEASKKTVSMIVGDRQNNSIRTSAQVRPNPNSSNTRQVGINVDARPVINLKDPSKIQLMFGLEYQPKMGTGSGGGDSPEPSSSSLSQRLTLNLDSGKPLLVSQAADPTSDRKITVEVTATILK